MNFKITLTFLILVFIANNSFGQTSKDFEDKYNPVRSYEIRPQTLVFPKFDESGQVCRAAIKPNPFSSIKDINDNINEVPLGFDKKTFMNKRLFFPILILDTKELREIFDELVPVEKRKGKGKTSIDCSGFGTSCGVKLQFEKVYISATVMLKDNARIDMSENSGDINSFFNPSFGVIKSANIVWTERTCSKN